MVQSHMAGSLRHSTFRAARRISGKLALTLLVTSAALMWAQPARVQGPIAVKHGSSLPLRDLKAAPPLAQSAYTLRVQPLGRFTRPVPLVPRTAPSRAAVQSVPGSAQPTLLAQFEAQNVDDDANILSHHYVPPDTNGSVGRTQYVQLVNVLMSVYDKTGTRLSGPTPINALWTGFGGKCETENDGDPIVLYDKVAQRWVISQFAGVPAPGSGTPYYECVAVSQTEDATGAYNLYSFEFDNVFPDYPKLGVWPDAYYFSANMFPDDGSNPYPMACAFDRASMLTGAAANSPICFGLDPNGNDWSLLPSDLDGTNAPPNGAPNVFAEYAQPGDSGSLQSLKLFPFHVDWTTPGNSFFGPPVSVNVQAFNPACGWGTSGWNTVCVPQPTTTEQLDSLSDRLMFRLAYRNFGDHESLVVSHSVDAGGGVTGVRWYEIRSPNGSPSIYQWGTYSPDSTHRWMSSIAMDRLGDIALGYSVSDGSSVHPGIRMTGRLATDPLGTLGSEATVIDGSGDQTTTYDRWGDYSSMSVDPLDDCTFWYTQEYYQTTGNINWQTRVASMVFPECTSTPMLEITKSHTGTFGQGQTDATYTLTVKNVGILATNGVTAVTVTDSLPAGLTATNLSGTNWNCALATVTCTRSDALAAGASYPAITVTVSVGNDATSTINTATATGGGDSTIHTASDPTTIAGFTLNATTGPLTVNAGASATENISLNPNTATVAAISFACSGLPAYTTCSAPSVPAGAIGATSVTLTLQTTGPYTAMKQQTRTFYAAWLPFTGFGLIGIVVIGSKRKSRKATVILSALLLILMLLPAVGCGSSSAVAPPRTPAGTYTITVSGTNGTATHTTTFNLTVN